MNNTSSKKNTKRKRIQGIIVGDSNKKTRIVEVVRLIRHPLYQKAMKRRKKFYAHDEKEVSKKGDIVIIEETRPMSKLKRWRIAEVRQ